MGPIFIADLPFDELQIGDKIISSAGKTGHIVYIKKHLQSGWITIHLDDRHSFHVYALFCIDIQWLGKE